MYSLVRVGVFALALTALMLFGINPFLAAFLAAVIGFCVSYIFLRKPRDAVATSIVTLRTKSDVDTDADAENEALDRADGAAPKQGQPG